MTNEIEKQEVIVKQPTLTTDEGGQLNLVSLDEQLAFADRLIKNKMISTSFETPAQVLIGIQYAKALGMEIVPALKCMYVLNGQPCLYGDGPLSLIQRSGLVEGYKEFFIDESGEEICFANKNLQKEVYASVCRIKRKGDSEWQEDCFSLDDLKQSGINMSYAKEKLVWQKFRRNMMRYKARSMALKSKFADLLQGFGIAEYDYHSDPVTGIMGEVKETSPINLDVL